MAVSEKKMWRKRERIKTRPYNIFIKYFFCWIFHVFHIVLSHLLWVHVLRVVSPSHSFFRKYLIICTQLIQLKEKERMKKEYVCSILIVSFCSSPYKILATLYCCHSCTHCLIACCQRAASFHSCAACCTHNGFVLVVSPCCECVYGCRL